MPNTTANATAMYKAMAPTSNNVNNATSANAIATA